MQCTYTPSFIGKQISWSSLCSTVSQVTTPVEVSSRVPSWGMETMIVFLTPSCWKYVHRVCIHPEIIVVRVTIKMKPYPVTCQNMTIRQNFCTISSQC